LVSRAPILFFKNKAKRASIREKTRTLGQTNTQQSLSRERALFFGTDANSNRVRYAGKKTNNSKRTKGAVLVAPQLGQHPIRAPLLVGNQQNTVCVYVSTSFVKACLVVVFLVVCARAGFLMCFDG